MRRFYLIILIIFSLSFGLSAQEYFSGEWHMQELSEEGGNEKRITSNEELREGGRFWIMKFWEDGRFYQTSNDNARGETDEMEGTWKIEPKKLLTIFLKINGEKRPLQFYYEFKGEDIMILTRYHPLGTYKLVVVFKRVKDTDAK